MITVVLMKNMKISKFSGKNAVPNGKNAVPK